MHNDPRDSTLMDLSNEFAHIVGDIHDINGEILNFKKKLPWMINTYSL